MLYVFAAGPDWIKMGFTGNGNPWFRVANGFWTNDHPPQLCGRLAADDVDLLFAFAGDRKVEAAMKSLFPPDRGEFYRRGRLGPILEMLRLMADELPVPPRPPLVATSDERLACCGGKDHPCPVCGKSFRRAHLMWEHRRDVHEGARVKCACGLSVTRRNLGRHVQSQSHKRRAS